MQRRMTQDVMSVLVCVLVAFIVLVVYSYTAYTPIGLQDNGVSVGSGSNTPSLPRVALCLYGLHKGRGGIVNSGFYNIEDQLLKPDGSRFHVDVFMHSYDTAYQDVVLPAYRPIIYVFEKEVDWSSLTHNKSIEDDDSAHYRSIHTSLSMLASIKASVGLKRKHEIAGGFRYDWVVVARVDACIRISCITFNPTLPTWRVYTMLFSQLNTGPMQDHFYSNSSNIDLMAAFFDHWPSYIKRDSEYNQVRATGWPYTCSDNIHANDIIWNESAHLCKVWATTNPADSKNIHMLWKWHMLKLGFWNRNTVAFCAGPRYLNESQGGKIAGDLMSSPLQGQIPFNCPGGY